MSGLHALPFAAGLVAAFVGASLLKGARRPSAANIRGKRLPLVLGTAITLGVFVGFLAVVLVGAIVPKAFSFSEVPRLSVLPALAIVFLSGLYDDFHPGPARGLVQHARRLAAGEVTPGIVKLVAALGAAGLVALSAGGAISRLVLGIAVMAGCANLWNLLDVAPGRAIKYFLPAAIVLTLLADDPVFASLASAMVGSALGVFPFDLREKAMLGDSGANALGFLIGVGLYATLSTAGLVAALAAIVLFHVVSETVTLSRVIAAVAPLRWFDRAGRIEPSERPASPSLS